MLKYLTKITLYNSRVKRMDISTLQNTPFVSIKIFYWKGNVLIKYLCMIRTSPFFLGHILTIRK